MGIYSNFSAGKLSKTTSVFKKGFILLTIFLTVFCIFNLNYVLSTLGFFSLYKKRFTSCKMTIRPLSRLGNNMFQHMALLKLALLNGCQPLVQPIMVEKLNKCFVGHQKLEIYNNSELPWYEVDVDGPLLPEYKYLSYEHEFVKFYHYPHDWHYLENFEDQAKKQFTFNENVSLTAQNFLVSVREKYKLNHTDSLIGVHIRRTDYLKYMEDANCQIAPPTYLLSAINWMMERHPNPVFIVASDNLTEAQTMMEDLSVNINFNYEMVPLNQCETMATITNCHHVIITQGTFGFWLGFLSGGDVVYYTNYCYSNTGMNPRFMNEHMPYWHPIKAISRVERAGFMNKWFG